MNRNPLVSVLMTAYNRENYIAEAIQSVLVSTYTNFELIIVDDLSNDQTVEIAKKYAADDTRIKLFVNEFNLGDYLNRNKAASLSHGKYLKYIDADDKIYPWGLDLLVKMMEQYKEAGWGLCSLEQDKNMSFPFCLTSQNAYKYHYFGPGLFHKAPLSSIIRKEAFDKVGGFSGKQHLGDFELWHILALHYPVVLMPQGIVWYREHDAQQSKDNRDNPEVSFKYIVSSLNYLRECTILPINKKEIKRIIKKLRISVYGAIFNKISHFKLLTAYSLYKATKNKAYNFKWHD